MAITLSPTLTAEMNSLSRRHASRATVERWLPEWSPKISGLTANKYEQYAHGHAACVAPNGNGAGEDILFRARSGSTADPFSGVLHISVLKGTDLDDPTRWDEAGKWTNTAIGNLMRPAWYNNAETVPASNGGSIAAVWSGTKFRVFCFYTSGHLVYLDFDPNGTYLGGNTVASFSTDTYSLTSMQLASCRYTEVFALRTELVEASEASWHKPIYGSHIHRYEGDGASWADSPAFPFHNQAEAALVRDGQLKYGSAGYEWGSGAATDTINQWGKRPCGGLAANEIDSNTVVVSAGFTFWQRYGYNTHNQGIFTFRYHRNSAQWERGVEVDLSDYVTERLDYALFARGSQVEAGSQVLVWSRYVEPSDYDQLEASMSLPRVREVVYAKFDPSGRALTQYQYLGDPQELSGAAILAVTHAGSKKLYALGWRSVLESPPAALLGSVPAPDDLELVCDGWQTSVNNRYGMSVDLNVADAGALFQPDSPLQAGRLVKIYAGTPEEQIQLGQGLVDTISPAFSLEQENHRAKLTARAEKGLLDPRSEELTEILPQNTQYIAPSDPIAHIANHKGYWETVRMEWPNKFFGAYTHVEGKTAYRLKSFPYAWTGGGAPGTVGNPGEVLNQRAQHKGTWWNDAAWTDLSPMVDGSIEATVRFGDVNGAPDFEFYDRNKIQVFATVQRNNGKITYIQWHTGGYGGPVWNTVQQNACMAGLICHAVEMNKKFSFVWESNTKDGGLRPVYESWELHPDRLYEDPPYYADRVPASWEGQPKPFSASSHTDDTWKAETMDRCDFRGYPLGENRFYLVLSDYDDSDPDWQKNGKWIHRVVAGGIGVAGLVPGQPADLKMVVSGGTIYCFCRPHRQDGQAPAQWSFVLSYKSGRFGAGRFGIVGRGHAGIQWDAFYYAYAQKNPLPTGRNKIPLYDNYVDFWDIKVSDCVMDRPLEEVLRRRCWQGFTPTEFRSLVNEPALALAGGTSRSFNVPGYLLNNSYQIPDKLALHHPETMISGSQWLSDAGSGAALSGYHALVNGPWAGIKAKEVREGSTNLVYNHDLSGTYTNGLAQSCTLSNAGGTVAVSQNTDPAYIGIGASSQKAIFAGHNSDFVQFQRANLTNNTTYTWYLRFYLVSGKARINVWKGSTSYSQAFTTPGWNTFTYTGATDATGSNWTFLIMSTVADGGATVYVDQAQIEAKSAYTGLIGGDLPGCTWSGTPRGSTSSRTRSSINLDAAASLISGANQLSFRVLWQPFYAASATWPTAGGTYTLFDACGNGDNNNRIMVRFDPASSTFRVYLNGTFYLTSPVQTFAAYAWQEIVVTLDYAADSYKLYINGVLAATSTAALIAPTLNTWQLGANYVGTSTTGHGAYAEYAVWGRVLSQAEITALRNQQYEVSSALNGVENLTIDYKMTLSAMGGEAGVICRAVDRFNLTAKQHVRLGLVVNGGLPAAGGTVTSYLVKRVYDVDGNGNPYEVLAERDYAPSPIYLHNAWPLPVRVTVRGNIYSLWIAGNYIGHFVDDTSGGVYFGLYALGATATFSNVYVPELYEVLENSTLEVNQTIFDAIKSMLGKRAIKGVFQPSGSLKLSYFETHETGPTFQDTLTRSAVRLSDRFFSIVRVDGAYTWATYASEVLLKLGRRFMQASFPDIFHREFAYKEARNLCLRAAEEQVQSTFAGLPDYRVQPEDKIEVVVAQQSIAGHFLVDDVSHTFQMDQDDPQADSEVSTRQFVVI
ncbi:MAG: hypothetical protein KJ077_35740 [Anaerolineae bacterium]|nr:hypothetical protein [Anaerolineae bacterium]